MQTEKHYYQNKINLSKIVDIGKLMICRLGKDNINKT